MSSSCRRGRMMSSYKIMILPPGFHKKYMQAHSYNKNKQIHEKIRLDYCDFLIF